MSPFDNTVQIAKPAIDDKEFISKTINNFVRNNASDNACLRNSASSKNYFNRDDVLKALSNIQLTYSTKYIAGQQVNINTESFKVSLLNSIAKLNHMAIPKTMNQIDGRTIDFVEMIFGAFLRNQNISDTIKTLILKLQIPVIKTSLIDNNFFYDNKHPARILLDTIAKLGIGIEENCNTVCQTIDLILDQLLRSYDKNAISYRTALTSLQRLKTIEHDKLEKNEESTRKLIIKEHARQLVLSELQYHTMNITLPKPIQPLLLNNWSTYMFSSYLKHGKTSYEWQESIDILKIITKSLSPIENNKELTSLKNNYQEIIDTIKNKLVTTNQNKERTFMAIANLKKHYENIIKISDFIEEKLNTCGKTISLKDSIFADKSNDNLSPVEQQVLSSKNIINHLPLYVKPGVWFKIYTGENSAPRRLKLSVITIEDARLIFVDRHGTKVIEKDAQLFSNELLNNQSHMLEDNSIFDNALTQVISNISNHTH